MLTVNIVKNTWFSTAWQESTTFAESCSYDLPTQIYGPKRATIFL